MAATLEFNALEFFKEEIRSENASVKLNALNNVHLIASAMGAKKTNDELIPFLAHVTREEPLCSDEEFLFTAAKMYLSLADYMDDHKLLIPELEYLAAQEETVIREEAIRSMCTIVDRTPRLGPEHLLPALQRLNAKQDFFTARVSACSLCPTAYKHATEDSKPALRKMFQALCQDDTPMVRRAGASKLKEFVKECTKPDLIADVVPIYKALSQEDTQDTIRVACVQTTLVLADMLNPEENRQITLQVIKDACTDRSWRVRLAIAKNFDQLCKAVGPDISKNNLMEDGLVQLLKDNEQEVRKEAVRIIEACIQLEAEGKESYIELKDIIKLFDPLSKDSAQTVRAALAQVIGPVAKKVGRDQTQSKLLEIISDFLKDEWQDVRLNVVSHAGLICEVLSVDGLVHSLLHSIQSLIVDNHWRIRKSVVEQVPKLGKLFGSEMFQAKLEQQYLSSLKDSVYEVRKVAIHNLKEITDNFGPQWTVDHLVPKVVEQYSSSNGYANRVTTLQALPQISSGLTAEQIEQKILPLIMKATKDAVPNVRFCACQTLEKFAENSKIGSDFVQQKIKPLLTELAQDQDSDVQYFSAAAQAQFNKQVT